jgi:hypothetical protein
MQTNNNRDEIKAVPIQADIVNKALAKISLL